VAQYHNCANDGSAFQSQKNLRVSTKKARFQYKHGSKHNVHVDPLEWRYVLREYSVSQPASNAVTVDDTKAVTKNSTDSLPHTWITSLEMHPNSSGKMADNANPETALNDQTRFPEIVRVLCTLFDGRCIF